ncbi:MAG: hypothetical protein IJ814_04655 [Paludibacteraceae bacterium]|nr:hypothetical protein [Paludibacteraceae bacterium]
MTKKDILDILYAERNRLTSIYTRPGWTTWALIGAIASLIWILLDLHPFSWKYSIAIAYLFFNAYMLVGCFITAFKNNHRPTWKKLEFTDRIGLVFGFAIYLVQFLLFIIYKTFFDGGILSCLYYVSLILNTLLLVELIAVFVLSFIPSLRTEKNNRIGGVIGTIFFLFLIITLGIFIIREHDFIDVNSVKAGLILFAIVFLAGCFNISTPNKLNKLDNLINRVLYEEDEIDEKKVLSELEICLLGLRYGDFLMNDNYEYIIERTQFIYWNLHRLDEAIHNSNDYTDSIRTIVKNSMDILSHLQYRINYVLKMVKLGYGEKDVNSKLSPLFRVMHDSLDLIGIWHEIWKKMSEYNFEDFGKFVNAKMQEADIIFKKNNTNNE